MVGVCTLAISSFTLFSSLLGERGEGGEQPYLVMHHNHLSHRHAFVRIDLQQAGSRL